VKTPEELAAWYELKVRKFPDVKMMGVVFGLDAGLARHLLPPPLEMPELPGGLMFIAEYGETNLGPGYREAALFLRCSYQGTAGSYCLAMPIDSEESRLHNGRDIYGFPKKAATIGCTWGAERVTGWVERGGVRFVELSVERSADLDALPPTGPTYLFKAMPRADLQPGFDGPVFLVSQQTEVVTKRAQVGLPTVTFKPSPLEPWSELSSLEPMMGFVLESENRMLPGKVLAEVDGAAYLPHYFRMTDLYVGKER
jgi:acetoacetate decarboxylase